MVSQSNVTPHADPQEHRIRRPRVAIADDHDSMRQAAIAALTETCEIVASVSDGGAAVAMAESTDLDVIVLDINMPILNGLDAAVRIRQRAPGVAIVFLTVYRDRSLVRAARRIGCRGFVTKSRLQTDLPRAVCQAAEGREFVSPGIERSPAGDGPPD